MDVECASLLKKYGREQKNMAILTDNEIREYLKDIVFGERGIFVETACFTQRQVDRLRTAGYNVTLDPRYTNSQQGYYLISKGGCPELNYLLNPKPNPGLKENHPATKMRRLIAELRQNIIQSGNPNAQALLTKLADTQRVGTIDDAGKIFRLVARQHQAYLEAVV